MNTTNYWQMAGLVMQLVQMVMYISGFNKYRERLEELADELVSRAEEKFEAYRHLRDKDPAFFTYYENLPVYKICMSNVNRSRGAAWGDFRQAASRIRQSRNGYGRYQRGHIAAQIGENAINATAIKRAKSMMTERGRVDEHILERWGAIIGAPTNPQHSENVSVVTEATFQSFSSFGRGANAAGASLGNSLFQAGFFGGDYR